MAIITFDFDDTLERTRLTEDFDVEPLGPNEWVLEALREHVAAGDEAHIVTSRVEVLETNSDRTAVADFVQEHGLPITAIHFTNGEWKAATLHRLGSVKHFDDDPEELELLLPRIEKVLVPVHESWTTERA